MNQIPDNPAYSKNVLEMLTVANDYCMAMAKVESKSINELISYLIKVSPLMYIKGALLEDIEVNNPDANQRFVTEEEWEGLFAKLRKAFGDKDEFWFIDNSENSNDPVKGSLAEHYADIYQDMKDFLMLYQVNSLDAKENAVSGIKDSFLSHWGYRLVNAHKTLHHLSLKVTAEPPNLDIPELF